MHVHVPLRYCHSQVVITLKNPSLDGCCAMMIGCWLSREGILQSFHEKLNFQRIACRRDNSLTLRKTRYESKCFYSSKVESDTLMCSMTTFQLVQKGFLGSKKSI